MLMLTGVGSLSYRNSCFALAFDWKMLLARVTCLNFLCKAMFMSLEFLSSLVNLPPSAALPGSSSSSSKSSAFDYSVNEPAKRLTCSASQMLGR